MIWSLPESFVILLQFMQTLMLCVHGFLLAVLATVKEKYERERKNVALVFVHEVAIILTQIINN